MMQELFGNKVKEIRVGLQMSQMELSDLTNIERAQISKIEQGKINVTLETIERLSQALRINVKDLFSYKKYNVRPIVKWAGGKTQIINKLKLYMPEEYGTYFEPFVGGGALLFSLTPEKAYINDTNNELLSVYQCLKDNKKTSLMVEELIKHENNHSEEYFYQIRALDRDVNYYKLPIHIRSARMVYLNKACFNGLYRVNSQGYFNVPSAKKEKVITFDRDNIVELQRYFRDASIHITSGDFEKAVTHAKAGDFVYFDPPYDVYPDKNGFVDYSKEGFGKEEQKRLSDVFISLSHRGVKVMLSNHNTEYIHGLYQGFNINVIDAKRMINSDAKGRGSVQEVIVTNY